MEVVALPPGLRDRRLDFDLEDLWFDEKRERQGRGMHIPSIRILMNNICMALSGLLSPSMVLSVISVSAAAAVLSWNDKKFWIL